MEDKILKIKDFLGQEKEVIPKLFLYEVSDFMGRKMTIPGIQLYTREDGLLMPYATLTKSFGEFIGAKNCAYIDTNNYSFAPQLLTIHLREDPLRIACYGLGKVNWSGESDSEYPFHKSLQALLPEIPKGADDIHVEFNCGRMFNVNLTVE